MNHYYHLNRKNNRGFTLVELSIVVVIVGLLIGGILVGQSLIESARMTGVIKEFGDIEFRFHTFKKTFKYFPGDLPNGSNLLSYSALNGNGDGNGLVEFFSYLDEFVALNKFFGTKYKTCTANSNDLAFRAACGTLPGGGLQAGVNIPESKYWKGFGYTVYNGSFNCDNAPTASSCNDSGHNYIKLMDNNKGYAMTPTEMMALDNKIDDGKSGHGRLVTDTWASNCTRNDYSNGYSWDMGVYQTSYATKACQPSWMLFADHPEMP